MRRAMILVVLGLGGCASMLGIQPIPLRTAVEVRSSEFEREVEVVGLNQWLWASRDPSAAYDTNAPSGQYFLRSWIDPETGAVTHQLYVDLFYFDEAWHHWMGASSEQAERLDVVAISSDVQSCGRGGRCTFVEQIGVTIPESMMERASEGFRVKLYAQNGREEVLVVTPEQVRAQVDAVEPYRP